MGGPICRWGILGAAEIARKNWQAIRSAGNCRLTAVASRDLEKGRQFVAECQRHAPVEPAPQVCAGYEELLARDDVDAVYVPLPTGVRKAWLLRAAAAGRHVLSEKPAGICAADVREILDACRRHRVQFMDGVMFRHSRRLDRVRGVLDDGESVGQVKRVASHFTCAVPEEFYVRDIRAHSELEPSGCLGDLGWYCIVFTLWVMNWTLPTKVIGHLLAERGRPDSPGPTATDFSAELFFPDGVSASFYCSFLAENQQWANIGGTKGFVHVPDFVLPYYGSEVAFEVTNDVFRLSGCDFNMENHTRRIAVPEYSHRMGNAQEAQMFRRFAELAMSGEPDPAWGEQTLKTQQVLDACLESARSGAEIGL